MTVDRDDRDTSGPLWLRLLPAVAFAATFGVFFVDKNREARTVLNSWRGLLAIAAVVAGYLVVSVALRRAAGRAAPVVLAGVVVGLAAWVVRPYYVDSPVNRSLVGSAVPSGVGMPAGAGAVPAGTAPIAAGPVIVASGPLSGIDHRARGTALLVRDVDGSLVVRLSEFDVEGVPDPRVHLIEGEDVQRAGGIALGPLAGNRGDVLDIRVLPGSSAGPGSTLLIWCRAFSVPVANATLVAPSP